MPGQNVSRARTESPWPWGRRAGSNSGCWACTPRQPFFSPRDLLCSFSVGKFCGSTQSFLLNEWVFLPHLKKKRVGGYSSRPYVWSLAPQKLKTCGRTTLCMCMYMFMFVCVQVCMHAGLCAFLYMQGHVHMDIYTWTCWCQRST